METKMVIKNSLLEEIKGVENKSAMTAPIYSLLDNSQYEVVTNESPEVLLRAPAGSGKTTTIIAAVVDYRLKHPNDRICAITYTRAAREEMEQRLMSMGVTDVEVTTIHV